eukprot:CAMPEP_0194198980 /NCGR_PEP_ID=MMETSP0156-20130528/173_1 /TAXON_ID=33649 /ORGANISM="Thalassionema nitzschioides, Strain L26-B" /LENGTH=160 /DNA_ID=CAMNT_0038923813 /DNA_START=44 /DNA_END=526 /DNA_ORIENTATION=+
MVHNNNNNSSSSCDDESIREVRYELDRRNYNFLTDDSEFKRVQAELRKSGIQTGMAALQLLDQQVTNAMIEKRRRKSLANPENIRNSLERRATREMIAKRKRSSITLPLDSPNTTTTNNNEDKTAKKLGWKTFTSMPSLVANQSGRILGRNNSVNFPFAA